MPCRSIVVIVPGIYAILMTSIMTCIFTRAFTDIHTSLLNPLSSFDYPKTYVELYLLVVIDAGLLLVASLIIRCCSCRTRKYTPYLRWALVLFQLLLYGYSLSKFLVFYEWRTVRNPTSPYQFDRFDILAMVFTPLLALGTIPIWIWMFKQAKTRTLPRRAEPERQHLLDGTVNRSYTDESDPLLVTGTSVLFFSRWNPSCVALQLKERHLEQLRMRSPAKIYRRRSKKQVGRGGGY